MQALQWILDGLAALGLATGVARSATVYALVSASHILGVALLLGPILLADLALIRVLRGIDATALGVLRRTARAGALLAVAAGLLLLSAKPAEYAANAVVWAKLGIVAVGLLNALVFEMRFRRVGPEAMLAGRGRTQAAASVALWLTALLLGRWIAFA
jgi:hypothetical protein